MVKCGGKEMNILIVSKHFSPGFIGHMKAWYKMCVVVKKSRHEKYLFLICFFKSRHEEYFCRSCFFKSGHGQ